MRNLAPTLLEPEPGVNVFSGDNGQGKTNILEAIYVLCTLRSFRARKLATLIKLGEEEALIRARVEHEDLDQIYQLTLHPRGRSVKLDGKVVRPISRYFGGFNVVLFAPEDLQIIKGSPAGRRHFLDRSVFNSSMDYLLIARNYEKVLKHRNALLRTFSRNRVGQASEMLAVYDQQLAETGARVRAARSELCTAMAEPFQAAFHAITQTSLPASVTYQTHEERAFVAEKSPREVWIRTLTKELSQNLVETRSQDLARGTTFAGPHRDDLKFRLGEQPAELFASQGQLRAMILAWKTAELGLLTETRQAAPILLLDDVSSELDATRNQYLFDFLQRRQNQCFLTTTRPEHVLLAKGRTDYSVEQGVVVKKAQREFSVAKTCRITS